MDTIPLDSLKFKHLMLFGWAAALPSILPAAKNYSSCHFPLPEGEREQRKKRRKMANVSRKRNRQ